MPEQLKVAVLGGGSFGTAIASMASANGHQTFLWMRDKEAAAKCRAQRENAQYLPGHTLPENLLITSSIEEAVSHSDMVVLSVPSTVFRVVAQKAKPFIDDGTIVVSSTKGIEGESFSLMSQILESELPNTRIGVLSGPNFAKEIVQNQYTGTVVASELEAVIQAVQQVFSSDTFRIYHSPDRYGVELGGSLKNIYAMITGMAAALGCGHNTIAMLITRSLAEMGRFATKRGAHSMTFLGLAGVGDLILTCTSDLSRNYRIGYALGQGKSLETALEEIGQVVEGVNTLRIVKQKADEMGVYMPLVSGLYAIFFENRDIMDVVQNLMTAEMATDVDYEGETQWTNN